MTRRTVRFLLPALLLLFAAVRFIDDTIRLSYPVNDLLTPWVCSKAFVSGLDPYLNIDGMNTIWASTHIALGAYTDFTSELKDRPIGYPITTLALLAPLTFLRFPVAVGVYLGVSFLLVVAAIAGLVRRSRIAWTDPRKLGLLGFALSLAPLHTGIHNSNLVTVCVALIFLSASRMNSHPRSAGILLGLAAGFKPQVAVLFIVYAALRRKWRVLWPALIASFSIAALAAAWMTVHGVPWFSSYLKALARFTALDGPNSFTRPDLNRFQQLNLHPLAFEITGNASEARLLALILFFAMAGLAAALILRRVSEQNEELGLSLVAVLSLLAFYQRFYTGTLLVFPLVWAFEHRRLLTARLCVLSMLPFLLPLVAIVNNYGLFATWVNSSDTLPHILWGVFLLPHAVWMELCLFALLAAALRARAEIGPGAEQGSSAV